VSPLIHALVRRVALHDSVEAEITGDHETAEHLRQVERAALAASTDEARFAASQYLASHWCSTIAEAEALAEEAA